ncbi:hypothetical protein YC2023_112055 [Brassica napus]
MERGGCKESHTTIEEAEKEKQCECLHAKMQECMETHSDYYHPIFAAAKEAGDKAIHREVQAFIIPSSVGRDIKEWRGAKVEEELEKFMGFMERGGCKESWMALVHCNMEDCAKEDRDKFMSVVRECLETHSDYYQPYFKAGAEVAEEAMVKHIIEAFSTTSDQPIAKAGEDEFDERFLDFMKGGLKIQANKRIPSCHVTLSLSLSACHVNMFLLFLDFCLLVNRTGPKNENLRPLIV